MMYTKILSKRNIFTYLGLTAYTLWSLFPIGYTMITSFRPDLAGLSDGNPFIFTPQLTNYTNMFAQTRFFTYLSNTVQISVTASIASVLLGLPAGYVLARFRFKGQHIIAQSLLAIRLVPPIVCVVPFFMLFSALRLLDTPLALILVYTVFLLPFSIWLFAAYIKEVPVQSEEAAMIDGLTRFNALWKVVLPQIRPAIVAVAMLNMVAAWNEFLFALILTSSDAVTLPVAISGFFGERGVFWGRMAAAGMVIMIFPILLSLFLHGAIKKGISIKTR